MEIVGCVPASHKLLLNDLKWIRELINSTKEEIREFASLLYGIIIAHGLPDDDKFEETVKDLITGTENNKYLETQHGCLLGVANGVERRITIKQIQFDNVLNLEIYKNSVVVISKFFYLLKKPVTILNNQNVRFYC